MTKLITLNDLTLSLKISKTSIYRRLANGDFPPPIKLGRLSRWRSDDVDNWILSLSLPSEEEANDEG